MGKSHPKASSPKPALPQASPKTMAQAGQQASPKPVANALWLRWLIPAAVAIGLLLIAWLGVAPILNQRTTVFAFNDNNLELGLSPVYRLPDAFLRVWDSQFLFGRGSQQFPVTAYHVLHMLLGPHAFRREGVLLIIWFAGLAGYWSSRQFKRSVAASLMAGLLLMLCGWSFTFPTVGLPTRTLTLIFSALALGWLRRGRDSGIRCDLVAGGFLGLAVSDTADVGMLFAFTLAAYAAAQHLGAPAGWNGRRLATAGLRLAALSLVSLAIAWQAISIQFNLNIAGVTQGGDLSPEARYEWATQWSLPKAETWSLFAADFHGASSRSGDSPYWGGMGRSAGWEETRQGFRNYRLAGYALGTVPLVLLVLLYAAARRRRDPLLPTEDDRRDVWVFAVLALTTLVLAWGKHFPLYRLFYAIPYMGTIRNPDKWLGPFTLYACMAVALAVDVLRRLSTHAPAFAARKPVARASAILLLIPLGIATIGLAVLGLTPQVFLQTLTADGYGQVAQNALQVARSANGILIASLLAAAALIWGILFKTSASTPRLRAALLAGLMLIMAGELLRAGRPYLIGQDYRHLDQPNPMTDWLDQHATDGRLKLLPAQHQVLNSWRMTYLMAKGYDMFDPVSISRMPTDYAAWLGALDKDLLAQWRLGSVRYLLCLRQTVPELQQLAPGRTVVRTTFGVVQNSSGQLIPSADVSPDQHHLAIVEYLDAQPLFHLAPAWQVDAADATGDTAVLAALTTPGIATEPRIQGSSATAGSATPGTVRVVRRRPSEAELEVETAQPGMMINTTKFDKDWKVTIDGAAAPLLRANYLFQAVAVPAGRHTVHFVYAPSRTPLYLALAGRLAWLLLLLTATVTTRPRSSTTTAPMPAGDLPA